jgi:hypothetical protein
MTQQHEDHEEGEGPHGANNEGEGEDKGDVVFESPVSWTGKRPKPNRAELRSGSACGYLYDRSFAVQLPVFCFKKYNW